MSKSNIPNFKTKQNTKLLALKTERSFLNLIKSICKNPTAFSMKNLTANSILNDERLMMMMNILHLKLGNKISMSALTTCICCSFNQ